MYIPNRFILGLFSPLLKFYRIRLGPGVASVKILIYHNIPENNNKDFYQHIIYLKNHYSFIDPDSFHQFLEGKRQLNGRHILTTFDDGFLSSKEAAAKILGPLGIKAIFFVPTGFIDRSKSMDWRKYVAYNLFAGKINPGDVTDSQRPMDWDDILWLKAQGHLIGAHTISHNALSQIKSIRQLEDEIKLSRNRICDVIGEKVKDIAYPFGDVLSIDTKAISIINSYFRYCYSGIRGRNNPTVHRLAIRRESVDIKFTQPYLTFIIEDGLDIWHRLRRQKLDNMAYACSTK